MTSNIGSDEIKASFETNSSFEVAELEAKETYVRFLGWMKKGTWVILAGLLAVASCNFGGEAGPNATGSTYEPENAKEDQQRNGEAVRLAMVNYSNYRF